MIQGQRGRQPAPGRPHPKMGQRPNPAGRRPLPKMGERPPAKVGQRPPPQTGQRPHPKFGQRPPARPGRGRGPPSAGRRPPPPLKSSTPSNNRRPPPQSPQLAIKNGGATKPRFESMEVEMGKNGDDNNDEYASDDDMESLIKGDGLKRDVGSNQQRRKRQTIDKNIMRSQNVYCGGTIQPQPIGNMWILFPQYNSTVGWGVAGPHWWGPLCVWLILVVVTHFCIKTSLNKIGPITAVLCVIFCIVVTIQLLDVSLRNPGICTEKTLPSDLDESLQNEYRWCDFCQVFQPPDGAHCPDCNICVAGYDHHCVWMGTCIGKRNYKQFIRFNISWLYYAVFTVFWVLALGPFFMGGKGKS